MLLVQSGHQGRFWTALLLEVHDVTCVRSHSQCSLDADVEPVLFELLHASPPLHKNSLSQFPEADKFCDSCPNSTWKMRKVEIKFSVKCGEMRVNHTNVYLMCVFAH